MDGHNPQNLVPCNGWFKRGSGYAIPPNYNREAYNVVFDEHRIKTRQGVSAQGYYGSALTATLGANHGRVAHAIPSGGFQRYITLNTSTGDFFLSSNLAAPIINIPGATDFSAVVLFGRLYFMPTAGVVDKLYVVPEGSSTARAAAGAKPIFAAFTATTSAGAGFVERGLHLISIAYETDTGFITQPGTPFITTYTAPGGKQIDLTNIPTGGAEVVKRHILMTKAVPYFNGDETFYELFFVGEIADNVTTTFSINLYDSQLVDSADYLLDQFEEIVSGKKLITYQGSLIVLGQYGYKSYPRVSKSGEPESFAESDGFIICDPGIGDTLNDDGVLNGIEFRGQLHLFKSLRHYVTVTNGNAPNTWPVDIIENGKGTTPNGVSEVLSTPGQVSDRFFISTRAGLWQFYGRYDEKPLSWVISGFWEEIGGAVDNVVIDPVQQRIYVLCSTAAAGGIPTTSYLDAILVCDYKNGLSWDTVRWSIWAFCLTETFSPTNPIQIINIYTREAADYDGTANLFINFAGNNYFYEMREGPAFAQIPDTIPGGEGDPTYCTVWSPFETHYIGEGEEGNDIHFGPMRIRASGSGSLYSTVRRINDGTNDVRPAITLTDAQDTPEVDIPCNTISQRFVVRIENNIAVPTGFFRVDKLTAYTRTIWMQRPR